MYNKKRLLKEGIQRVLTENSPSFNYDNIDSIKSKNYNEIGFDYWAWIDFIGNLEAAFSKDLTETTDKFKIETIDEVLNALYSAPNMKNLYKN